MRRKWKGFPRMCGLRTRKATLDSYCRTIFAGDGTTNTHLFSSCPRCGGTATRMTTTAPVDSVQHRSWLDLLEVGLERPATRTLVRDIMKRDFLCVRPELSVETLSLLLVERELTGAAVVDGDARLLGFVTLMELVRERVDNGDTEQTQRMRARIGDGEEDELDEGFHVVELTRNQVGSIMGPAVLTLFEHEPLSKAAALMAFNEVHLVPVIDGGRRVVGLVSVLDLVGWLAAQSGYLIPGCSSRPHELRSTRGSVTEHHATAE
jgi:CBS domain-containing protein